MLHPILELVADLDEASMLTSSKTSLQTDSELRPDFVLASLETLLRLSLAGDLDSDQDTVTSLCRWDSVFAQIGPHTDTHAHTVSAKVPNRSSGPKEFCGETKALQKSAIGPPTLRSFVET